MSQDQRPFYDKRPRPLNVDANADVVSIYEAASRDGCASVLGERSGQPLLGRIEESVAVLGGTRMGKSTAYFIPSVASFPGPVIATSTRNDLRDSTIDARQRIADEHGGKVYELDPLAVLRVQTERLFFDPVEGCQSWTVAYQRALLMAELTIVDRNQSHWRLRAAKLAASLMHAAALSGDGIEQVIEALELQEDVFATYRETLRDAADRAVLSFGAEPGDEERHQVFGTQFSGAGYQAFMSVFGDHGAAAEERKSITSTASSIFAAYSMRGPDGSSVLGRWTTEAPQWAEDFSLEKFLGTPSTIYITVPEGAERELQPVVAAFVDKVVRGWKELSRHERSGGLYLALDEAANICPLPQLPRLMTTGGGDQIHVAVGLQDPQQVEEHWHKAGHSLINSANHLVLFPGIGDTAFLKNLSDSHPQVLHHELIVEVNPQHSSEPLASEPQTASHHRLIQERSFFEDRCRAAGEGVNRDQAATRALQAIFHARVKDRVVIRQTFLQNASGLGALRAELFAMTKVRSNTQLRPSVEVSDIANPPEGHVYRRSGSVAETAQMRPYFLSPFWTNALQSEPERTRVNFETAHPQVASSNYSSKESGNSHDIN